MQQYAIIVAGGSGSRMATELPKQFIEVAEKPILIHTLERFLSFSADVQIVLVLPEKDFPIWATIAQQHADILQGFNFPVMLTAGGKTRFQSVRNGLEQIKINDGVVAVHDGVRPFVSAGIIKTCFDTAKQTGTAVSCVSLKDSARVISDDGKNQAVHRERYRLVQTPQVFELNRMRMAFAQDEQPFFTDCASVFDHAGEPVTLVEGAYTNIKITTPEDLIWAKILLENEQKS